MLARLFAADEFMGRSCGDDYPATQQLRSGADSKRYEAAFSDLQGFTSYIAEPLVRWPGNYSQFNARSAVSPCL